MRNKLIVSAIFSCFIITQHVISQENCVNPKSNSILDDYLFESSRFTFTTDTIDEELSTDLDIITDFNFLVQTDSSLFLNRVIQIDTTFYLLNSEIKFKEFTNKKDSKYTQIIESIYHNQTLIATKIYSVFEVNGLFSTDLQINLDYSNFEKLCSNLNVDCEIQISKNSGDYFITAISNDIEKIDCYNLQGELVTSSMNNSAVPSSNKLTNEKLVLLVLKDQNNIIHCVKKYCFN